MKKHCLYPVHRLWLLLLLHFAGAAALAQPGGWSVDPGSYQFNMTLVAQIRTDDLPNHSLNNHLAVFSHGQIRGYAAPMGFNGQAYYFLNLYSNLYNNDTLYFRCYIGADQKIYESVDTVVFSHLLALGTVGAPYQIDLYLGSRPLIYSLSEVTFATNDCSDVLDVEASDDVNSEGNGLTYSIVGGADADRFSIHPQTGILSWFNFMPNFAMPVDADADNRYEVTVKVADASDMSDIRQITVTVEDASVPLPPLVCPDDLTLLSSDDGTGDCGATTDQTGMSLPNPCAESLLIYELTGATTGSGSGLVPPDQIFAKGLTTVIYIRTGGGSGSECAFTLVVQDDEVPVLTCPADMTVSPNIFDTCSALVNGIDAVFSDNCSGATLAYVLSGATTGSGNGQAGGQTFLAGTTLVTYTATDGADHSSDCSFAVTVTECNTVFSGNIEWEHDGTSGVQNATVSLTGAGTGSSTTDLNGYFVITLPPTSGDFTLTPTKNINKLNGVTSADVTAIQQHVSNNNPLPAPYKRIAADVNKSNSITTLDVTVLYQALLGNPAALNQITSWRFVPSGYIFPNPDAPWGFPEKIELTGVSGTVSGQDFYGIKVGDVVATWANPANFGAGEHLILRTQDQVPEAGAEVVAEFRADQMDDLNSFQFALHFDPAQLQLLEIEVLAGSPLTMENFGTFNVAEGEIRAVWANETGIFLDEGTPVFRLRFKALGNGKPLSEVLRLEEENIPARAYNSVFADSPVELHFSALSIAGQAGQGYNLWLQNRPNPFTGAGMIAFILPVESYTELRVTDISGRVLFSEKQYRAAGKHTVTLSLDGVSGVLVTELITPFGVLTRKMVAVKN